MAVRVSVATHSGREDGAWVVEEGGGGALAGRKSWREPAIEVKAALQQTKARVRKPESRERRSCPQAWCRRSAGRSDRHESGGGWPDDSHRGDFR